MGIKKEHLVLALPFFLLGLALVLLLRVQAKTPVLDSTQINNMAILLQTAVKERDQLSARVSELQVEVNGRLRGEAAYSSLSKQLEQAQMAAGMVPLRGQGVTVTMNTQGTPSQAAYGIHDSDILQVINELRAAGAEAISVNGQRVVATTEIRQAGNIFSINNTLAGPPFTINAIGDPATLSSAIQMRGGVADSLGIFGILVNVTAVQSLEIPAYNGIYNLQFAKAVTNH